MAAGSRDYMPSKFNYDQTNKLSQSALERRSRSFRKFDSKMNQSVTEKDSNCKIFEGGSNVFTQRYQDESRMSIEVIDPRRDSLSP